MYERTQEIKHQAFHDKLTGLPNRAAFMDRVKYAVSKSRRQQSKTAVLFLDLDNFKLVNDSLGHEAGDEMLVEMSKRILACTRPDDCVARLGGDEFTVLLEDLPDLEHAKMVASRILTKMKEPVGLSLTETFGSVSIGICFSQPGEMTAEEMIKNADMAMYEAKSSGRSKSVTFKQAMQDKAADRFQLETELRVALEKNEFRVVYQPLVSLTEQKVIGAEALIRWHHPTRGNVPPSHFIPIAEEIGVVVPLGYWVLEQACRQMGEWHRLMGAPDLTLSVNLSGKQVQRRDVIHNVSSILHKTGFAPSSLQLELTETVLLADCKNVNAKLTGLKDLGVQLALDDFGTGYSSLSILSAFPIDTLKIDKSFVSKLEEDHKARAVVDAIMALTASLKLRVTSEGIETPFECDYVKNLGCEVGQGYLFSKPLEASEFLKAVQSINTCAGNAA